MASRGGSKRASEREDNAANEPAAKRPRTASEGALPVANAFDGEAGAEFEDLSEPEDPEDPEAILQRIQEILDGGGVDQFAQYMAPILEIADDPDRIYERDEFLLAVAPLMERHNAAEDFWAEAWPLEVYVSYNGLESEYGTPFDTPWSGDYTNPGRVNQADIQASTRWNWYKALKSFRDNHAEKNEIIEFADHYKDARNFAARGYMTNPPLYLSGQEHADYLAALKAVVDEGTRREPWLNAIEQLRLAFGNNARDDLRRIFDGINTTTEPGTGAFPPHDKDERNIWWKYLLQSVNHQRTDTAWFQALFDYMQDCDTRFEQYRRPQLLKACVAFAKGKGTYGQMCTELETHLVNLRKSCMRVVIPRWKLFVQAGTTRTDRISLYKMFHSMQCHYEAGGLPYFPPADYDHAASEARSATKNCFLLITRLARPLWNRSMPDPEKYAGKSWKQAKDRQAIADIERVWKIALAKFDCQGATLTELDSLHDLKTRMEGNALRYGPEDAVILRDWEELRVQLDVITTLSPTTKFRFQDLCERVMDFKTRFGVLISCRPLPGLEPSDQTCEDLVNNVQNAMKAADHQTWITFWDFTRKGQYDDIERARLETLREKLHKRGYYWPPHETEPVPPEAANLGGKLGIVAERSGLSGRSGIWKFKGPVGSGAYGHAGLWELHLSGRVVDRIVVKESYQGDYFDNPLYWEGELYRRVIKEYSISRYLANLENSQNIVKPMAVAIYETLRMYRVYMEYCPHGNLEETIERYDKLGVNVPERQIWATFEALINALCLLSSGHLPGTNAPTGHTAILHRDVKPLNVFVGAPQETTWPGIPIAKLGDFGLATRVTDTGSTGTGMGTDMYRAPEQQPFAENELGGILNPVGVCPASDLWAVARVMLCLINLEPVLKTQAISLDSPTDSLRANPQARQVYTQGLCELVERCLVICSADRPLVDDVWRAIQQEVGNASVGFPAGLRVGAAPAGEVIDIKEDMFPENCHKTWNCRWAWACFEPSSRRAIAASSVAIGWRRLRCTRPWY